jgi:hypothetical protein
MSLIPPQDITIPVAAGPDAITVHVPGEDVPVTIQSEAASNVVVTVPAGSVGATSGAVVGGGIPDNEVTMIGPVGGMGQAKGIAKTSTGHRVWPHEAATMQWEPGMGPFFSQTARSRSRRSSWPSTR